MFPRSLTRIVPPVLSGFIGIAFSVLPILSTNACADVEHMGNGNYMAGVPSSRLAPAIQKNSYWCWAACIQMCLNTQGVAIEQSELVKRVFGGVVDAPADDNQMIGAIQGNARTDRGEQVQLGAYELSSFDAVLDELESDRPVIAGMSNTGDIGHAQVLTAVEYGIDEFGDRIALRAILRDPRNGARLEMPWGEFRERTFFMLAVVARPA